MKQGTAGPLVHVGVYWDLRKQVERGQRSREEVEVSIYPTVNLFLLVPSPLQLSRSLHKPLIHPVLLTSCSFVLLTAVFLISSLSVWKCSNLELNCCLKQVCQLSFNYSFVVWTVDAMQTFDFAPNPLKTKCWWRSGSNGEIMLLQSSQKIILPPSKTRKCAFSATPVVMKAY